MRRLLESQAPVPQKATEAILVLGNRLTNATLLQDKRDAILGLRSFAKDYPADVASSSWRSLLDSFNSQQDDSELIRLVLEILLLLLSPTGNGLEDTGEIALMLADQFTQNPASIERLLQLVELGDLSLKLFSLQLLRDVASIRPDRTKECLLSSPGATGKLVALLRAGREMIQEEALHVLLILTQDAPEVQKLVLFEGAAEAVLLLCSTELAQDDGSVLMERSISLLGNLILSGPFNQDLLRELGFLAHAQKLMDSWVNVITEEDSIEKTGILHDGKNLWGFISILRSFLVVGNSQLKTNQDTLWKNGLPNTLLDLAFCETVQHTLRQEAFLFVADLIRANANLQEQFALLSVPSWYSERRKPISGAIVSGTSLINVIEAILDLLLLKSMENLQLRLAALEVFKAYMCNHHGVRKHFLHRALQGYLSNPCEPENVLTILCQPLLRSAKIDSASVWFSTALMFSICYDDGDVKSQLSLAADGGGTSGEEQVSLMHTICSVAFQDQASQHHENTLAGYITLLSGWLYDEPAAVDVFLRESIYLDHLFALCEGSFKGSTLINGLSAFLLGIIYEFSYATSAIPRKDLQLLIVRKLGKVKYHQDLVNLKRCNPVRTHMMQSNPPSDGLQPLDGTFIDFFLDKFDRVDRAIDRDFDLETIRSAEDKHAISRTGISHLRQSLVEAEATKDSQKIAISNLQHELDEARETIKRHERLLKSMESQYATDVQTINANNATQRNLEQREHERTLLRHEQTSRSTMLAAEDQFKQQLMATKAQNEQTTKEFETLLQQERAKIKDLGNRFTSDRLELEKINADLQAQCEREKRELESERMASELAYAQHKQQQDRWQGEKTEYETRLARMQTEIDDVLILLSDLEEKRRTDKKRLREAGCVVDSDGSDAE